ncbi:MAG: sensor domain-containing diguanylate cyclase [Gemmatimonadota bacterium]|nr:sensor domain-containing diguanylate cyclase [Gemmatimonadota bacterium]
MAPSDGPTARSNVEARYKVLLEAGRILTSTLSVEELYAALHEETAKVLSADNFSVSLYDQGRDLERVVFRVQDGAPQDVDLEFRGSDSEVIRSNHGVLVEDDAEKLTALARIEGGERACRSGIAAPLAHHGRVIGAVSVCSPEPDAYTSDDLALLQGIADVAAIAIDNALQFEEIERRRKEAERIEEIGRVLTSERDPNEVLGRVVEAVLDVLDVDGAAVWQRRGREDASGRITDSGGDIVIPVGTPWELADELEEALIAGRRPAIVDDIAASRLIPEHLREHLNGGSGIAVPIVVEDEVVGALVAGSRQPRDFGAEESAVLQRLARQASVALENARLHETLRALSLTDPLTGLPNRRRLQLHLEQEVAAARRGRPLTVVVFDIDNFKRVNDAEGHLVGDDILRSFAHVLVEENRAMNLVGRYGGDEFVSVLSDSDREGAKQYLARVQDRLESHAQLAPHDVSVSMGIAEFDSEEMQSVEELLSVADLDMYRIKAERRAQRASGTGTKA